ERGGETDRAGRMGRASGGGSTVAPPQDRCPLKRVATERRGGTAPGVLRGDAARDVARAPLRRAALYGAVSPTNRARGGIPGSSSMIPTDGLRLNRACPAPPGLDRKSVV